MANTPQSASATGDGRLEPVLVPTRIRVRVRIRVGIRVRIRVRIGVRARISILLGFRTESRSNDEYLYFTNIVLLPEDDDG